MDDQGGLALSAGKAANQRSLDKNYQLKSANMEILDLNEKLRQAEFAL